MEHSGILEYNEIVECGLIQSDGWESDEVKQFKKYLEIKRHKFKHFIILRP